MIVTEMSKQTAIKESLQRRAEEDNVLEALNKVNKELDRLLLSFLSVML